ncbi:hypothetical protein E5D57_010934 [Metarhizium anisopliae]|nr:hypothetical protein E5D57_010934 [Metarhizium anisopliae]
MAFTRTTSMPSIYPLGSENQSDIDILATVRVENVGPLTSEVVTTGQERTKQGHADCWIAKPLTALSRQKVSVRLAASAHKLLNHIQQTRGSDEQRWLRLCTKDEQEACMFNLAVNDRQEYEILDGTLQRIRSLPTVPIDTPDAEHHVLATLQHLAEFKYAEGIEIRLPNSSLEASFSLLSSADGKAPDASAVHDIEHGGIWRLALDTPRRLDKTLARAKLPGTGSMGNSELHHTHRDARERLKTGTSFFN